jgi:hypothetical protein
MDICTEQTVQNLIVGHKLRQNLSAKGPAGFGLLVIMSVPAFLTAVFLICPAIPDLLSAM